MKKRITVLALVLCAVFLLAACNAAAGTLVGKWRSDSEDSTVVEFMSNGTANTYYNDQVVSTVNYKTDGNKLTITYNGQEQTGSFKIDGNKLTLVGPNNETSVYTKE